MNKLLDPLDDNDDVQVVYLDAEFPEQVVSVSRRYDDPKRRENPPRQTREVRVSATFGVILFTAAPEGASWPGGAFTKIDGRESLLRAVDLFVNRENIRQIVVGFCPADDAEARGKFGSHLMFTGAKAAAGGPGLREQLAAAAAKLPTDVTHVIIHDAARPAVASPELDDLLVEAAGHEAIAMVARVNAPVVQLDEAGVLGGTMTPRSLRSLLTPMVMRRAVFDEYLANGLDAVLSRVAAFESSPLNVRINAANEAGYLKACIALLPKPKFRGPSNPFEEATW